MLPMCNNHKTAIVKLPLESFKYVSKWKSKCCFLETSYKRVNDVTCVSHWVRTAKEFINACTTMKTNGLCFNLLNGDSKKKVACMPFKRYKENIKILKK